MKSLLTINRQLLQALCVLAVTSTQHATAKTIKIENTLNEPVTVFFPHVTTTTGIERYPTLETIVLKKGQSTTVSVKPYEYMSDLYIPNWDWAENIRRTPVSDGRKLLKEWREKYSFAPGTSMGERFSIKVLTGSDTYYFVHILENSLGKLIKKMAEKPTERPADGIRIVEEEVRVAEGEGGTRVLLSVTAGSDSKVYQSEAK